MDDDTAGSDTELQRSVQQATVLHRQVQFQTMVHAHSAPVQPEPVQAGGHRRATRQPHALQTVLKPAHPSATRPPDGTETSSPVSHTPSRRY